MWMHRYIDTLSSVVRSAEVTDKVGQALPIDEAIRGAADTAQATHSRGNKLMFVGNGGSAGICSHMATDYSKNGNLRSMALNDGSMLTCLGNDYGYEHVFAKQIEFHARPGDYLVALSSSGASANILNAVAAARKLDCTILTLSGFSPNNPLRKTGDLNFYLESPYYGFVEIGHLALCHAILDYAMECQGAGRARKTS